MRRVTQVVPSDTRTYGEHHIVVWSGESFICEVFKILSQSVQSLICQLLIGSLCKLPVRQQYTVTEDVLQSKTS